MPRMYEEKERRLTISWTELPNNKYLKKIKPTMFYGEVREPQQIKAGQGKDALKKWVEVIYDRSYVEEKLFRDVIQPLYPLGKEKILEIITQLLDKAGTRVQADK